MNDAPGQQRQRRRGTQQGQAKDHADDTEGVRNAFCERYVVRTPAGRIRPFYRVGFGHLIPNFNGPRLAIPLSVGRSWRCATPGLRRIRRAPYTKGPGLRSDRGATQSAICSPALSSGLHTTVLGRRPHGLPVSGCILCCGQSLPLPWKSKILAWRWVVGQGLPGSGRFRTVSGSISSGSVDCRRLFAERRS